MRPTSRPFRAPVDGLRNRRHAARTLAATSPCAGIERLEPRRMFSVAIASGQTIAATIAAAKEVDSYTISGVAGGSLLTSVAETTVGSLLSPKLQVFTPGGVSLGISAGATGVTRTAFNLPTTGTYVVQVSDNTGTNTGGYALTAVSIGAGIPLTTGGDGGPTLSGVTHLGTLDAGDIDAFSISGVAGGTLLATAAETVAGSTLTPSLELYSPTGALLTSTYGASGITRTVPNLPATGNYTVVVRDINGVSTGGYAMTAVSVGPGVALDPGGDGGVLASGQTRAATLGAGDIDAFTVAGVAGGTLLATAAETVVGSALSPSLELYSPSGVLLTSTYAAGGITRTASNLPLTGNYTIVVRDVNGSGTGAYAITPVSIGAGIPLTAGGDGGATLSGVTRTGTLDAGDIDAFTINGVAGGTLLATAAETVVGSVLSPSLEIYSPAGVLLQSTYAASGITRTALNLPTDGAYTIVVRDVNGSSTGAYAMTAVAVGGGIAQDPGGDAGPLASALTHAAALAIGDVDAYTIAGVAGGSLLATVAETVAGSALSPSLELYSPAGVLLQSTYGSTGVTRSAFNLPTTGTYTVIVRDVNGSGVGGYAVTAVSLGAGIAQSADGDGGFIPSGVARVAAASIGDIDAHPFFAVAGDKVVITATETIAGSALAPDVELYSPSGTLLLSTYNAATATLTSAALAASGAYTIIVRDVNGSGTGGYTLALTQTPGAPVPAVSVVAGDAVAIEGGIDNGQFTFTRTNVRALPLTVQYAMSGTATNGVDYAALPGSIVIPANAASVTVTLSALTDAIKEATETAVLSLKSGAGYVLAAPASATVSITDATIATLGSISGRIFNDANGNRVRDIGELWLGLWRVYIDVNKNGIYDAADTSSLTDINGNWSLTGLAAGSYVVHVVQPAGTVTDAPVAGTLAVTLLAGQNVTGLLFGERSTV